MVIEKSHFTKCDCGTHMLECERFDEGDADNGFYFSFWHYGHDANARRQWKERFRWCWRILRTGNPWADSIVVNNTDARQIAEFILQNLPKEEPK